MSPRERYADRGVVDFEDLPRHGAGRYPLTDLGNAEYFAARYTGRATYDHRRKRWLLWQGHRWAADVDGGILRLAVDAIRERQREAIDLDDEPTARAP